jgi:hypothetical protein
MRYALAAGQVCLALSLNAFAALVLLLSACGQLTRQARQGRTPNLRRFQMLGGMRLDRRG